jgi:hypothetical protein
MCDFNGNVWCYANPGFWSLDLKINIGINLLFWKWWVTIYEHDFNTPPLC